MIRYGLIGTMATGAVGEIFTSPPNYWSIAANLGAVGIVAWLVWYQNSKYIPALLKSHEDTLQQMAGSHSSALKNVVAAFKEEMKSEREQCEKHHQENRMNHDNLMAQMNRQHDEVIRALFRREDDDK